MKRTFYIPLLSLLYIGLCTVTSNAQISAKPPVPLLVSNPWLDSQLLEPAELAGIIKSNGIKPVILNIGAVEDIPGATHIGAVSKPENMKQLQNMVAAFPKKTAIVIYCGCCPFTKCPNIRPAFLELEKLGFTYIKVLDLPTNLNTNWISKGYPLKKE